MADEYDHMGIKRVSGHLYTDGEKFYVLGKEVDLGGEARGLVGALESGDVAIELPQEVIEYFTEQERRRSNKEAMQFEGEDALMDR